jgi:hypothetical protein
VNGLRFRVHWLDRLADLDGLEPVTLMLHGSGLTQASPSEIARLHHRVAGGLNVIVLADEFYKGTTRAANAVLAPFGLGIGQADALFAGASEEERIWRTQNWQLRYEWTPFDSQSNDVCPHPLTRKVARVHWFRPSPVSYAAATSFPLVKNPHDSSECFAAVAEPKGYVVAVGLSLWSALSAVGWPYDNDRLLANLLAGGDAESGLESRT